jgi:hypothetical protein
VDKRSPHQEVGERARPRTVGRHVDHDGRRGQPDHDQAVLLSRQLQKPGAQSWEISRNLLIARVNYTHRQGDQMGL